MGRLPGLLNSREAPGKNASACRLLVRLLCGSCPCQSQSGPVRRPPLPVCDLTKPPSTRDEAVQLHHASGGGTTRSRTTRSRGLGVGWARRFLITDHGIPRSVEARGSRAAIQFIGPRCTHMGAVSNQKAAYPDDKSPTVAARFARSRVEAVGDVAAAALIKLALRRSVDLTAQLIPQLVRVRAS